MSPDVFDSMAARVESTTSCFKVSPNRTVIPSGLPITKKSSNCLKKTPHIATSEISNYCANNVISSFHRQAALVMWDSIPKRTVFTPFDKVSHHEHEIYKIF